MANVLKFQTLVACKKGLDNRADPDQTVCYSDKHFVNSSLDNQHFSGERNKKSVPNFTMFTQSNLSEYRYLRVDIETTECLRI